jgi:hypothetical protein
MTSVHARQMEPPPEEDTGNGTAISAEAAAQYVTQNASATAAEGFPRGLSFMIRDEPGYRIQLSVEDLGAQDAMEIVLRTAESITWWKSLSYFPHVQGGRGYGPEIRIETKDRIHEARQLLYLPDITRYGILELWKGGFGGFGAFAGSLAINADANVGSSFAFLWLQD